jgi:hypothetical protein
MSATCTPNEGEGDDAVRGSRPPRTRGAHDDHGARTCAKILPDRVLAYFTPPLACGGWERGARALVAASAC